MLDINPIDNNKSPEPIIKPDNQNIVGNSAVTNQSPKPKPNLMGNLGQTADTEFVDKSESSKTIFYVVLIVTIIVVGVAGYLYYLKSVKTQELKTKETIQAELNVKLAKPELVAINKQASTYSLGLDELSKLIVAPIKYSKLFDELEKIIPNEVTLDNLSVDDKGKFKAVGKTIVEEAVPKFIEAFEGSSFFDNVTLDGDQEAKDKDNKKTYTISVSATLKINAITETKKEEK